MVGRSSNLHGGAGAQPISICAPGGLGQAAALDFAQFGARVFRQGANSGPDVSSTNGSHALRIRLVVNGRTAGAECSAALRWHGQRVQCVQRGGGCITGISGVMADGWCWWLTLPQVLAELQRGQPFYVEEAIDDRVEIGSDVTPKGRRFLRMVADGDRPNKLSQLPSRT